MLKIAITGGGTGGHAYPLIAIVDALRDYTHNFAEFHYFGSFQETFILELRERSVAIHPIAMSKWRRYFSLMNAVDTIKFIIGLFQALVKLYALMPDILFSKGGPGTLPVVLAARFYFIPVVIHESDAVLSLTNSLTARFAKIICTSFEIVKGLPKTKKNILFTGNPVRREFIGEDVISNSEAKRRLGFRAETPLIFFVGGSQGAQSINNFVLDNLLTLLPNFQVYHQTGVSQHKIVEETSRLLLANEPELSKRYRCTPYLDTLGMRTAYLAADLIISRAGGSVFEIAAMGKPAILVPLPQSANGHQKVNAYEYARSGAAIVIEEENFNFHLVLTQINLILGSPEKYEAMKNAAKNFSKPQAAADIAQTLLSLIK